MASERDMEIDRLNQVIELDDAMARLEANKDFVKVFGEQFIEAFAITTTMQFAAYDIPTRTRTVEKTIARSHFVQFIEGIKESGAIAREQLGEVIADTDEDGIEE